MDSSAFCPLRISDYIYLYLGGSEPFQPFNPLQEATPKTPSGQTPPAPTCVSVVLFILNWFVCHPIWYIATYTLNYSKLEFCMLLLVLEQNCGKKWKKVRHRVLEKKVLGIFGPEGGKMQK